MDKCKAVDAINWQMEEISSTEEPNCYDDED